MIGNDKYIHFSTVSQNPLVRGSSVALVTPFDETTGNIDETSLRALLQFHVEQHTDNVCILGTTGESAVLSMAERERIIQIAVSELKGKIPILVGTGSNNPVVTKEMTLQAMDLGCDACLVVTPYYSKPPQRGLIRHMTDMADVGLPLIVYNVPGRTAVDMSDESIAIAAEHPNIIGAKDATGNLDRVQSLLSKLSHPDEFLLYSGDDATSVDFCLSGGSGCISVTANVVPNAMHEMIQAALAGDNTTARDLDAKIAQFHDVLFCETSPMPVKYAMSKLMRVSPYCRPPLDVLAPQYRTVIDNALREAKLIV